MTSTGQGSSMVVWEAAGLV